MAGSPIRDDDAARLWLAGLGVGDPERARLDLEALAGRAGTPESAAILYEQLDTILPQCPDPAMALANLGRYVEAAPRPTEAVAALRLRPRQAEGLLQLFSTSQYFSDLIVREPAVLDWLWSGPERRDRDGLFDQLWALVLAEADESSQGLAIRRFRHRQMLRIGYNDIVRGLPVELIAEDLSNLADACAEAACRIARAGASDRHGEARGPDGRPLRFVVLALGKLGGGELNYSSDIDLMFIYESDGLTAGPRVASNSEFFTRMGGDLVRLLSDHTEQGQAYRVDMRLRPDGAGGPLARSLASTVGYYETSGRTWERQALIKCRPIAGDLSLGRDFLDAIAPFVHRRYLSASEIGEIKAMKRRIEARTRSSGGDDLDVKTGRGGLRDVEFVVQFLQLLHGGAEPSVRHPNTLAAIDRLETVGCLTSEERAVMEDTYRFLRRVEHRLQAMFDRQTHRMPDDPEGLRTLAIRLGYPPMGVVDPRDGPSRRFLADYRAKTDLNRKILDHLLHDAFADDDGASADPVVDLVLVPDPSPELVAEALAPYPFRDRDRAHKNLMALAVEDTEFLSQARCRHFLAAIAPSLLRAVAETPDPDMALTNLEKVSASLGAKAILWELFSLNPPSLRLYVELCSASQFLSEILVNNPGMIDDLIDSLVVDRPKSSRAIRDELAELCRGAEDPAPILLSFRNSEWLRVGTRDVLGREPFRIVARELADVAEAIVAQVARDSWNARIGHDGPPLRAGDSRPARWAVLGLGRLGGREMSYHSDVDLIFLYDEDGSISQDSACDGAQRAIKNAEFFASWACLVTKSLGGSGGPASLYKVDLKLRPYGGSGPMAISLGAFRAYHRDHARPWERLALTRARVVADVGQFGREVAAAVAEAIGRPIDPEDLAAEVVAMRRKRSRARPGNDLKYGPGGLVDTEFLVEYLMLSHAADDPGIVRANLWEGMDSLRKRGVLSAAERSELRAAYEFRRTVEARLRLAHDRTDVGLPDDLEALAQLSRRLGDGFAAVQGVRLLDESRRHADATRRLFNRFVAERSGAGLPAPHPATEGTRR